MNPIRILVVDDSITMRRKVTEVLAADPGVVVVAQAEDGRQAVELCAKLRPDVVTMDMALPGMSGLEATEHIMAHFPTPILVVSSSTNRVDLFHTYDALSAGAVDVLEKPRGDEPDGVWEQKLVSAVKLVSRIRVITHPRGRLGKLGRVSTLSEKVPPHAPRRPCSVIALGASTGGPMALIEVLRDVPVGLMVPIVIVLHINEPFGAAFADWLGQHTSHAVSYPRQGEPLAARAGTVVMAVPGRHLIVREGRFEMTNDPERHSCRPSIDVLFESLARENASGTIACLLTGMGRDGASGLLEIRRAGGLTIAQDEKTSVVYGMPREAVLLGAAERTLPLNEIGRVVAQAAAEGLRS